MTSGIRRSWMEAIKRTIKSSAASSRADSPKTLLQSSRSPPPMSPTPTSASVSFYQFYPKIILIGIVVREISDKPCHLCILSTSIKSIFFFFYSLLPLLLLHPTLKVMMAPSVREQSGKVGKEGRKYEKEEKKGGQKQ